VEFIFKLVSNFVGGYHILLFVQHTLIEIPVRIILLRSIGIVWFGPIYG